ncbi:hypothetical protein CDV50_10370 [Haematobacter massiliensis]|uniref:hypothetical protein n=1 Tax=Haematobacter massiliensis TaxID=195105 RepID=UPI000B49F39E|nr:hypothetical protein [Haematobacter massiliensis]OWJ71400.1 hypothetical protein CDV50_10370 [Haematobacter massiliensis]
MEPATTIIKALGGPIRVSEIAGVHRTRVYSWMRPKANGGTGGIIPFGHIPKLIEAARQGRVKLKADDFLPVKAEAAE